MQNEMRDRLVELIIDSEIAWQNSMKGFAEVCADYLIEHGTVVFDINAVSPKNRPLILTIADMPLDEVIDLIKAKQEGRIIVLPCKVGDTVYMPERAAFPKGKVSAIHLNGQRSHIMVDIDFHFRAKHYLDEYGTKWFTEPKEAEV